MTVVGWRLAAGGWTDGGAATIHPPPSIIRLAADSDHERRASIQSARFFTAVVVLRALFAVADRAQTIGADAAARQVVAHRRGAPLAERQVVLGRPDVARESF